MQLPIIAKCVAKSSPGLKNIAALQVHNGMVFTRTSNKMLVWLEQEEARAKLNEKCGHLVHLKNLFGLRSRPDEYPTAPDTSWHWVFGLVVKPVA